MAGLPSPCSTPTGLCEYHIPILRRTIGQGYKTVQTPDRLHANDCLLLLISFLSRLAAVRAVSFAARASGCPASIASFHLESSCSLTLAWKGWEVPCPGQAGQELPGQGLLSGYFEKVGFAQRTFRPPLRRKEQPVNGFLLTLKLLWSEPWSHCEFLGYSASLWCSRRKHQGCVIPGRHWMVFGFVFFAPAEFTLCAEGGSGSDWMSEIWSRLCVQR